MRYIKLILPIIGFCAFSNVWAQLSTNEKPVSFGREAELCVSQRSDSPTVTVPRLTNNQLNRVEARLNDPEEPTVAGYGIKVDWNLNNSGTWYNLPNGDKLWRLNISCPEGRYILLYYDKFWLPDEGELYLYSVDSTQVLGAFTSRNNKGDNVHLRRFATGLIRGKDAVLEYYQPNGVAADAIISICNVVYGGGNFGFNKSDNTLVNINCDEGYYWRGEQKAVARIMLREVEREDTTLVYVKPGTGSLISTSNPRGEPYFLTAYHCLPEYKKAYNYGLTDSIMDDALFFWKYEMPGCERDTIEPPLYCTAGADIVSAYDTYADFALLRLKEDPNDLSNYIPYYLGWDNSYQPDTARVCIHHPMLDVKKISTVDADIGMIPTSYNSDYGEPNNGDHWRVCWKSTVHGNGGTQAGSSGAPLLNASHKVIGQLHGSCADCNLYFGPDWFGRLCKSWNNYNTNNALKPWLDLHEQGTGDTDSMEGTLYVSKPCILTRNEYIYGNILITETGQLTITGNIESSGVCPLLVEAGGKLIIDGGKLSNVNLELKPGATLRILNGGIIETQNGFTAPVGVVVDISHGKIL